MKLVLPLPPNRGNGLRGHHWAVEERQKNNYYLECLSRYSLNRPPKPYQRARISVKLFTHQPMDEDNLHARLKFPIDWLQEREYIVDDSPKVLVWGPVTQAIDRKNQRLEITLEEIVE